MDCSAVEVIDVLNSACLTPNWKPLTFFLVNKIIIITTTLFLIYLFKKKKKTISKPSWVLFMRLDASIPVLILMLSLNFPFFSVATFCLSSFVLFTCLVWKLFFTSKTRKRGMQLCNTIIREMKMKSATQYGKLIIGKFWVLFRFTPTL